MARAGEVFEGATLTVEDDRRDYGENRFHHDRVPRWRDGGHGLDASQPRAAHHKHEEGQ